MAGKDQIRKFIEMHKKIGDIIEPEEFQSLTNTGILVDGTSGGLIIGRSHEEGGIFLVSSVGNYFKITGLAEGYQYILNMGASAVTKVVCQEIDNLNRYESFIQALIYL